MAGILRTFAIAAGAGVAFGLCATVRRKHHPEGGRGVPDIDALLDRLENLERRFEVPGPAAADIEGLERLHVLVDVRAEEIQQRLEAAMDVRNREALAAILNTVEARVAERIAPIERDLEEQSASIHFLRDRAHETDANLKRLITAIERLCERTQPAAFGPPVPAAGPVVVPYESHQEEEEAAPEFRSRIFMEEDAPKRPRFPLARLLGMIALVLLTQVVSK